MKIERLAGFEKRKKILMWNNPDPKRLSKASFLNILPVKFQVLHHQYWQLIDAK
jgi:hypothetical protein